MRRQILLGIVLVGTGAIRHSDLTEDQSMGLLNDDLAKVIVREHTEIIVLTDKGRKIYQAFDAVVAIGTQW